MELTQLKYFLTVAETQHMTRSASLLHVAQPALTKSIKLLEAELGVPLFARRGRNIVLTVYGKYLKEHLAPILDHLEEIPHLLRKMAEREAETIRINVLSASMPVTEAVIRYRRENPSVNFQITQNVTDELYDIRVTTRFPSQPLPEGNLHILNEEIFLAVPDISEYAGRDSLALSEVKDSGFISLVGSKQLRVLCDRFCRQAGFEPNVIFESDSPDAARNMIEACLGVGFWPEYSWGMPPSGRIRLLHTLSPKCRRELLFSCRSEGENAETVKNFFDFLIACFENIGS